MTQPTGPVVDYPLGPGLDFLQRIWQLNHALERISIRMEANLGVTAQQRFILRCIGKYPGITAGHLAMLLRVDPGTVSASLNRLEKKGLLDRRRDPKDKRRAVLGLTAKGRSMDRPANGTVESAVERFLAATPAEVLEVVTVSLDHLSSLLIEECGDAP
jgi:MarR family transcriptional regulator, organic hydroperoxide resistance regulator